MSSAGIATGMLTAVDSFRPSLVARSTGHQALLFGISSALGYTVGRAARRAMRAAGLRGLPVRPGVEAAFFAGAAASAVPIIIRRADQEYEAHQDWGVKPMHAGAAAVQGTLIALAVVGATSGVSRAVSGAAGAASRRIGGPQPVWGAAGTALAAAAAAASAPTMKRVLFDKLAVAGTTADPAFAEPPLNRCVSGSPGSLIPFASHAREGSRLVHLAQRAATVSELTGAPAKDPIRVFVGVSAAATPEDRVALAVAELERLGAFERAAILAVSPAGTGYSNPVSVEALEYLTGGDCATVAIQYGVLPSMLSRGLVPVGGRTYRLLVEALSGRGPKVFAYGESLGAECAQAGLREAPSRWRSDGSFEGLDACLFVGTPAGAGILADGAEDREAVLRVDRWQDLPAVLPPAVSVFLLDHDADPVTKFEARLIWSRPAWLRSSPRGRGVPQAMAWRPLLTYLQVGFDVARATQPQVGRFMSHGHDYRADLAPLVDAAFVRGAGRALMGPIGEALVRSEVHRTELLTRE